MSIAFVSPLTQKKYATQRAEVKRADLNWADIVARSHLKQVDAAEELKVSVRTLRKRCRELGISRWRFDSKNSRRLKRKEARLKAQEQEERKNNDLSTLKDSAQRRGASPSLRTSWDLMSEDQGQDSRGALSEYERMNSIEDILNCRDEVRRAAGIARLPDDVLYNECRKYDALSQKKTTDLLNEAISTGSPKGHDSLRLSALKDNAINIVQRSSKLVDRHLAEGNEAGGRSPGEGEDLGHDEARQGGPASVSKIADLRTAGVKENGSDVLSVLTKYLGACIATTLIEEHESGYSSLYHHSDAMVAWLIGLGFMGKDWTLETFNELDGKVSSGEMDPLPILNNLLKVHGFDWPKNVPLRRGSSGKK